MKFIYLFLFTLFFFGCSDSNKLQELDTEDESKVFKSNSYIDTKGKAYTLLIFGSEDCIYCRILKKDIMKSREIRTILDESFNTYYIMIDVVKEHVIGTNSKEFKVVTEQFANMYKVKTTPTSVIVDKNFSTVMTIPGYLPPEMFISALEFISDNKFTSRENIYKEFQDYLVSKGLM